MGYIVDARWLKGEHQIHDGALAVESATETMPPEGRAFAEDDVEDLRRSDVLLSFSEAPRSGKSRGGRHVEFGMALAFSMTRWPPMRLIVVGPRENIFHCLPQVEVCATWEQAKALLNG